MTPEQAFATLGLAPGAAPLEIRAAFRARAKAAHPDVAQSPFAVEFAGLSSARVVALDYAAKEPCPACGGLGKIAVGATSLRPLHVYCPTCRGSGKRHN